MSTVFQERHHAHCSILRDVRSIPILGRGAIALLLGMPLHTNTNNGRIPSGSVVVEITDEEVPLGKEDNPSNNTAQAKVTFPSQSDMLHVVTAYQGLAVPMTHGYHYYTFSGVDYCGDACTSTERY